jgi:hypothetical protein
MSKKKREDLTVFGGIKKGAPSKALSKREIYMENLEYFHIARALYASRPSSDVPRNYTKDDILKPSFLPLVAQEHYEMYETYVGDHDGREPRFQFDYLFNIELPVLKVFLPHLRYADKFNEFGAPTTFSVHPDSIGALIRRRKDREHFYMEDLASFSVGKNGAVVAPWDCAIVHIVPIQKPDETLGVTDDPSGKSSLQEFVCDCVQPKYDDIGKRYYVGIPPEPESGDPCDCECICPECGVNDYGQLSNALSHIC